MSKICYKEKRFTTAHKAIIDVANGIIDEYAAQGFDLTLRQLYYQFVARDLIANRDTEYKRLGSIINDARLAGLVDWESIQDRTRSLRQQPSWESPEDLIRAAASQYRRDAWVGQTYRPEVWIEKDALIGVIEGVCDELGVPHFSCRGYTSQSEMWAAGQRILGWARDGQTPILLHLGDHDPSGIDMTRDIADRLKLFTGGLEVRRLALNMEQVEQYTPPPNPAKMTDSRFAGYIELFGGESWELDALDPPVMVALIRDAIEGIRDEALYEQERAEQRDELAQLQRVAEQWDTVTDFLEDNG